MKPLGAGRSSVNPAAVGQSITYTATVTPAPNGGAVAFTENGSSISGGTAQPVSVAGTATCIVRYASTGTHDLVATYGGVASYSPSASLPLGETIANLAGANLVGAGLSGANLSGTCPDGTNSDAGGGTCIGHLTAAAPTGRE